MGLDHGITLFKNDREFEEIEGIDWRKCNHFRKWFADHAEGFVDNGTTIITRGLLVEFLDTLKEVNEDNSKASELLPSSSGFFFGSTEYDWYYFHTIEEGIEDIEGLLNDWSEETLKANNMTFAYWEWY